ncbi:EF-P lysine aminoacylase GenX [Saccharophagus sp. K07]|jgi:lysyl-tRNA synthetase class 2|uniref:EF-P lysine aminoacylase EpmA n=1 Tax=Saccharophagus sp. K07 TaxID=2283636 RepID=UPI0016520FA2|nr:EF-P lysine aminoacylase EpmA [Saccharophagus sp. K07]MBC6904178.1 EF-P lysine aminoacylase GenX [Saccharophagus sp. K07]
MFQPSASLANLQKRAQLLQQLRAFFYARDVMEVDVPAIGAATVTDIHLEPLVVPGTGYLQTSPEYFMKRLLAAGSPSIFYLGKAYRSDESGRRHRPEFTMLEWYRLGFDDHALMQEMAELFRELAPHVAIRFSSYTDAFQAVLGLCPHRASLADLQACIASKIELNSPLTDKSSCLDLLFSHCVEPELGNGITFVYDFPREQCALARMALNDAGQQVARRFEVYWDGMELANGYWELCGAEEQRKRFESDRRTRTALGLTVPEVDERFLAALETGLPECAGVALGVDRLLMCLLKVKDIREVMPFADL